MCEPRSNHTCFLFRMDRGKIFSLSDFTLFLSTLGMTCRMAKAHCCWLVCKIPNPFPNKLNAQERLSQSFFFSSAVLQSTPTKLERGLNHRNRLSAIASLSDLTLLEQASCGGSNLLTGAALVYKKPCSLGLSAM